MLSAVPARMYTFNHFLDSFSLSPVPGLRVEVIDSLRDPAVHDLRCIIPVRDTSRTFWHALNLEDSLWRYSWPLRAWFLAENRLRHEEAVQQKDEKTRLWAASRQQPSVTASTQWCCWYTHRVVHAQVYPGCRTGCRLGGMLVGMQGRQDGIQGSREACLHRPTVKRV